MSYELNGLILVIKSISAAMLLRRIKKEKRARRRLQEQIGGNQSEEKSNAMETASVTSQDSDKPTPGRLLTIPPLIIMYQATISLFLSDNDQHTLQ